MTMTGSLLPWITMSSQSLIFKGALHLCFVVSERASEIPSCYIILWLFWICLVHDLCWKLNAGFTYLQQQDQTKFVKCFIYHFHFITELLEDKQWVKLGGVGTSPSYLLFQTLLPLFWTLTCMIWIGTNPD